jgi:2-polyprenyl-6-methoxyphenol hydroxylase-like FAD-dependent oxidoreductase
MNDEARLKTWNTYQAAWGPIDEDERRRLLEQSVAADCVYTDPGSQVEGRDALMARIGQTQIKFPGAHFRNDSFLEHHDQGLYRWTMYDGAGRVFVTGDAAHLVIPTGGLGMNTGVGDAVDLGWKLAATLQGWGGPNILRSYEIERRQVGDRNVGAVGVYVSRYQARRLRLSQSPPARLEHDADSRRNSCRLRNRAT